MTPRPAQSRPLTRRLPIALAAGALAVATAVTPAFAADDPNQGGDQGNWSQQSGGNGNGDTGGNGNGNGDTGHGDQQSGGNGNGGHDTGPNQQNAAGGNHGDQGRYKGRVTARKLALRTAPNRGAHIIRYAHQGEVVSIFCKVPGDKVNGNPLWYLLTNGTWAWGPAGHIDNIGPAPRWC
ncbi:SH3 domain-containing protein [Streptomyces sp. NPDC006967]|uniref:SH3 domain-containing protein n=1 Tax=unclassified Streptomyces TaxID=2593676 RepID=UPI000CD51E62|nr:SH3 domain-containing protein [Streptomyces sp. SM1]